MEKCCLRRKIGQRLACISFPELTVGTEPVRKTSRSVGCRVGCRGWKERHEVTFEVFLYCPARAVKIHKLRTPRLSWPKKLALKLISVGIKAKQSDQLRFPYARLNICTGIFILKQIWKACYINRFPSSLYRSLKPQATGGKDPIHEHSPGSIRHAPTFRRR